MITNGFDLSGRRNVEVNTTFRFRIAKASSARNKSRPARTVSSVNSYRAAATTGEIFNELVVVVQPTQAKLNSHQRGRGRQILYSLRDLRGGLDTFPTDLMR